MLCPMDGPVVVFRSFKPFMPTVTCFFRNVAAQRVEIFGRKRDKFTGDSQILFEVRFVLNSANERCNRQRQRVTPALLCGHPSLQNLGSASETLHPQTSDTAAIQHR